nr:hypothetical protein [Tanacetum cinerariifolium]
MFCVYCVQVKERQEKDKIGSKPDKNEKCGEAQKSQKQPQSREKEKMKKMQVKGPKCKILQSFIDIRKDKDCFCNLLKDQRKGPKLQIDQSCLRRVVPKNYNPKGERFLIASRFLTPPLACSFFSLRSTVTSSSKLSRDQTSNPNSSTNPTPKGRIRRSSKQKVENSNFEEHLPPIATMTDNRPMAEMLRAPTEGGSPLVARKRTLAFHYHLDDLERYKDLLRACPHHGFTELHQVDTFYNALNPADQDSLNAAVGGNLLEKSPQDALTIIENISKVRSSRSKPIASPVNACDINSNSEIAKLTHVVNQQTSDVTTAMTAMLKQLQATPPPAPVKAVEEICFTCGGAHSYYQCLAADGNTFLEFRDNIQGYVSADASNYNQGNPGYRPQGVANQMQPPGFAQPNVQNNQNRSGQPQGFNRGTNFNQEQPYQATSQSNQNFHLNELEKIKRMNDTSLSNQTNEIKNMMASLLKMSTASTSGSGSLPGNTVANPKGELKAITTRSGLVTDGPTVPTPPKSVTPEEDERVEETYTDLDLAEYTIKVPPPPIQKHKPPFQRNFVLHIRDSPLSNIPELKCKALTDLGASINLMPRSVWKKLGLPVLIPTRMTLELANCAICTPDGIARDVFVSVGKFTFPADFVVVDYESDPRVPLILGRPFLRTTRALIDVHGEEMILRDGDERLTLNMKHDTASYSNLSHRESVNLINMFNVSSEDCLEDSVSNQQSGNPTFSLYQKITSPEVTHVIHDLEGCNFLSKELPDIDSFNDIHPHFDFDIESDLREIEFLLYQDKDSDVKDLINQTDLVNLDAYFVDPTPEMFHDKHAPDYSFPLRFNVYPDDFLEIESDADNFYDDPFDSKGEKIKESKFLIDELDLPCDFLPYSEYDYFASQDFSRDDDLPSPNNEAKYLTQDS